MRKVILLFTLLWLTWHSIEAQETKRVLFIGNSYIYSNDLPGLLSSIATSLGDTLIHDQSTFGGHTLNEHSTEASTMSKIKQGNWDAIVIQEQSQIPSFPPSQVATDCYPYAQALSDTIKKYNDCAKITFFMTWGRENGDAFNCPNYPPLCTYYGMQQRLRDSYLEMAADNGGQAAPVGAVWKHVRDNFPSYQLYISDGSHPSYAGSYLAACTFYATLFGKTPEGATEASLNLSVAEDIQSAAALVVLDSLDNWLIDESDANPAFDWTLNSGVLSSIDATTGAASYAWYVEDSIYSTQNFTHTFTTEGTYTITLEVADACGQSEILEKQVVINCLTNPDADFITDVDSNTLQTTNQSINAQVFEWHIEDSIYLAENVFHIFETDGLQEIQLVAIDTICGTADTSTQTITIQLPSNVQNPEKIKLQMAPNPASEHIYVQAPVLMHRLEVYDGVGRMISNQLLNDYNLVLDIRDLPPGWYLIRSYTFDGRHFVGRFIKR